MTKMTISTIGIEKNPKTYRMALMDHPRATEIVPLSVGGSCLWRNFATCKIRFASKSCILLYWHRYCMAYDQCAWAKLCGVKQRAPPIFARAAITLGIGPHSSLLRPPYVIGQTIIFLPCGFFFFYLSIYLFSSPNLSRRRLDVCHTSTHGVALVRI